MLKIVLGPLEMGEAVRLPVEPTLFDYQSNLRSLAVSMARRLLGGRHASIVTFGGRGTSGVVVREFAADAIGNHGPVSQVG